jgi:hypothetical protein
VTLVRLLLRTALAALVVTGVLVIPTPQPVRAGDGDPEIALLEQSPAWVAPGGDALLRLDVPAALIPPGEQVTLRLRIHRAVTTTTAFARTVEGDRLGNRIDSTYEQPLDAFLRDAQGAVYVAFGLAGSTRDPAFNVRAPGVYPLEIALRSDETLSSLVTWVVVADPAAPPANATRLASVWNVTSPPVRDPTGAADPELAADFEPGGRLDDIAGLLDDPNLTPITLAIGPETIESWAALAQTDGRLASGLARVQQAAASPTTQLLPAPYVPIDLTSLEAAGLGTALPNQLRTGAAVLEQVTGVAPSSRTAFLAPVDAPVLAHARDLLIDRVGIRASALANVDADDTLQPFTLAAGDGTARAVATNPEYEELLTSHTSPALRALRVLAALAVLTFEREDAPSGVVLAAPDHWAPDPATQRALLRGLTGHPYVVPVTLDTLFADVPEATDDGAPVLRPLAPHEPEAFPVGAAAYAGARRELNGVRSSLGPDDPSVLLGEHALDLALSSDNSPRQAADDLAVVAGATDALRQGVNTAARRVTLTARRANVPVSFVNTTGRPVRVRVQLASEKLLFPEGSEQVVEMPDGTSTEQFAVEARAYGTFTMTVSLASADGSVRIGPPTRISVRSAGFSGSGAALTAGALLVLALWWGNHFRRTRRARRAALSDD